MADQDEATKIQVRPYRVVLWSTISKDPFLFDIEVPNGLSAVVTVAHLAQIIYPQITKYEIYDRAEQVLIAQIPIGLAISSITKRLAEWLGVPMPLNAARIVRPQGDDKFDLADYFTKLREGQAQK